MARSIGILVGDRITSGLIEDHKLVAPLRRYPADEDDLNGLTEIPVEELCRIVVDEVEALEPAQNEVNAVGIAVPGMVRNGVIEDSPNLIQLKGAKLCSQISAELKRRGLALSVALFNDADAVAAGLAATRGHLDRLVRVWTIGNGIGFGRYPFSESVWEGGHMVVTLDPKENYCGCGGRGHLEGIMGHRAMRMRFLDMEPDEVFAAAKTGDKRCSEFVQRWHRALAAATATMIHLEGPGRFYFTGRDINLLDLTPLKEYLWESVKMSPLQSYTLEITPQDPSISIIGAGAGAIQFAAC